MSVTIITENKNNLKIQVTLQQHWENEQLESHQNQGLALVSLH